MTWSRLTSPGTRPGMVRTLVEATAMWILLAPSSLSHTPLAQKDTKRPERFRSSLSTSIQDLPTEQQSLLMLQQIVDCRLRGLKPLDFRPRGLKQPDYRLKEVKHLDYRLRGLKKLDWKLREQSLLDYRPKEPKQQDLKP